MGALTAGQVLAQVDGLLPNAYTQEEKLRWLAQAEAGLIREVWQPTGEAPTVFPELREDTVLKAETPYEELYSLYVQGQIHYANGDMTRCSNAMSLWNQGVATMQAERLRRGGMGREARHLRLC